VSSGSVRPAGPNRLPVVLAIVAGLLLIAIVVVFLAL
jgi:serine/threonine-protein kinase